MRLPDSFYTSVRNRLNEALDERGLDGFLATSPADVAFLSGFFYIATERPVYLWMPREGIRCWSSRGSTRSTRRSRACGCRPSATSSTRGRHRRADPRRGAAPARRPHPPDRVERRGVGRHVPRAVAGHRGRHPGDHRRGGPAAAAQVPRGDPVPRGRRADLRRDARRGPGPDRGGVGDRGAAAARGRDRPARDRVRHRPDVRRVRPRRLHHEAGRGSRVRRPELGPAARPADPPPDRARRHADPLPRRGGGQPVRGERTHLRGGRAHARAGALLRGRPGGAGGRHPGDDRRADLRRGQPDLSRRAARARPGRLHPAPAGARHRVAEPRGAVGRGRRRDRARPGMLLSSEPGVYVPGHAGYRISDTVLVEEDGPRRLTRYPRDLASNVIEGVR